MNIESQIKNWQNKFNKGVIQPCRECHKPIYMDKRGAYCGPCPHCSAHMNVIPVLVEENLHWADGGDVGIGKKKIYPRHLVAFAIWWIVSVIASVMVTGLCGAILSILFNILLTIIGFRAFTFEIHHHEF